MRLPRSAAYDKNHDGPKGPRGEALPCAVCGLACPSPTGYVRLADGGDFVFTEDEWPSLDPGGDLYFYPVGAGCVRRYPALRPFIVPAGKAGV